MRWWLSVLTISCLFSYTSAGYFSWMTAKDDFETTTERPEKPSNLGCFLCTQLLSVTKHRVGLSQNQLRNAFYEKCRLLPVVFKEQCFTFVESSLPEIYFALNYDFSTKDICYRLHLCDENSPFAVGGPSPEENTTPEIPTTSTDIPTVSPTWQGPRKSQIKLPVDRIGNSNDKNIATTTMETNNGSNLFGNKVTEQVEEKRMTCAFCERMLENAKTYAVTTKADITVFANTVCTKVAKGPTADQCYQLADKRIAELAKFVDQQVVEALWCAELNQC